MLLDLKNAVNSLSLSETGIKEPWFWMVKIIEVWSNPISINTGYPEPYSQAFSNKFNNAVETKLKFPLTMPVVKNA